MDLVRPRRRVHLSRVGLPKETPLYSGSKDAIADGGYFYLMPVGETRTYIGL